jgi:lysophospholipase L1-like esterase
VLPKIKTVYRMGGLTTTYLQDLYLDRERNWLRPDLAFVDDDGLLLFETNEIGLKGEALDPVRKLSVVWGDSVVFGIGAGWPSLLNSLVPGYQFLNGGIEGDQYEAILQRALRLNRVRPVALNLVLLGWHHIGNNRDLSKNLSITLGEIPNIVLVTMPTALNKNIMEHDLREYFEIPGDYSFHFTGNWPEGYSTELQKRIYAHIRERNAITREVAKAMSVPLIDLYKEFDTSLVPDFRQEFFDFYHPRPSAYPRIAQVVASDLRRLLRVKQRSQAPD